MTSFSPIAYPSMFQIARRGNVRAIACLINSYLAPYGIYVRAQPVHGGCLPLKVEFESLPNQPEMIAQTRDRLIRFICHHLWRLNSEAIEGVRIIGLWSGNGHPNILWKQSVRIVTPANQRRKQHLLALKAQAAKLLNFKVNRLFLLTGFSIVSFLIGFSLVASQQNQPSLTSTDNKTSKTSASVDPSTLTIDSTAKNNQKNQTIQTALEEVEVVQHTDVKNPHDPTVTMMFGGDVTLGYAFGDLIGDDYEWAFDQMPEYRAADVAMVNLEGTLTTAEKEYSKTFNFKADPKDVAVLTHGGVDIVNLGNNHAMDYLDAGLQETIATLEAAGIHSVGAGMDITEARRPEILEVKGQRIAYFGYYADDVHSAAEGIAGTNHALESRIAEDIKAIRDRVDWIIVNFHWGVELSNYPEYWQSDLAHFTIDQGADVIVGHHPHVLQGSEIYKGRPIAYSLGNFIFGGNARSDYDTAVLKVSVREKQMKVEFLPVEVRKYQPKIVQGDRGERIMAEIAMFSSIFDRPMNSPMILDTQDSEAIADSGNSALASDTSNADSSEPSTQTTTLNGEDISFPLNTTDDTDTFEKSSFTSDEDALELVMEPGQNNSQTTTTSPSFIIDDTKSDSKKPGIGTATAIAGAAVVAGAAIATRRKSIQLPNFLFRS
jgi:poly-gamma-glutamate capsule biosynthesis protein CapA/YwtB (metallophosphatase superfamily)